MILRAKDRAEAEAISRPTLPGKGNLRLLMVTGLLSIALYVCFYLLMISRSLWEVPTMVPDKWKGIFRPLRDALPFDWVKAKRDTPLGLLNDGLYLALIALLFAIYFIVVWRLWRGAEYKPKQGNSAFRRIFIFAALFMPALLVVHGALSTDLYSYIWYGRIFAIFGDNPYLHVPAEYAWWDQSRWIQWVYWKGTPSVYGPVWMVLAGGIARVAQAIDNDIVTHLMLHKVAAVLAHLLNVWLIWRVSALAFARFGLGRKLVASAPANTESRVLAGRIAVTATYAWNPLMLIEFGANGHNDVMMVTGILATLWCMLAGRWRLASLALAAACLVKLTAVLLLPALLWMLVWGPKGERVEGESWWRRGSRVAQALALFWGAVVLAYVPFWQGPDMLRSITGGPPAQMFVNSLADVLRNRGAEGLGRFAEANWWQPYNFWTPDAIRERLDWPLRWGPLLITFAWLGIQALRVRDFPHMVRAWASTMFVYLTIGSVWFWPWYVSWLIVPVALLGPGRLFKAAMILTFTAMCDYALFPTMAPPFDQMPFYTGLVIMVPPLGYLTCAWLADKLRARRRAASPTPMPLPEPLPAAVRVPVRPESLPVAAGAQANWHGEPLPETLARAD